MSTDRFILHPDRIGTLPDGFWDEELVREYLEPGFELDWDDMGQPADLCVQAAIDSRVLESPEGILLTFRFDMGADGHDPSYCWAVDVNAPEGGGATLVSHAWDYPRDIIGGSVGAPALTGKDTVLALLADGAAEGNRILDSLDRIVAARAGR